jgi:hypothetical protein
MKAFHIGVIALIILVVGVVGYAGYSGLIPFFQPPQTTATFNLFIRDPPPYSADVQSINITFTRIEMHRIAFANGTGESWINLTLDSPVTINLLTVINTTKQLGSFFIPAGNYTELRFIVGEAKAEIGGAVTTLRIPSGDESGLKVIFPEKLNLKAGQTASTIVDINADDNNIHNGILRPTLKATFT